jgi:nickel/cobalt exporter
VILGVFVTLSHTSGIVLVGVLAALGSAWLAPQRIEMYLALATGILVIGLGLWMLWMQRDLVALAMGAPMAIPDQASPSGGVHGAIDGYHVHSPARAHAHVHEHDHGHDHADPEVGWHTHGWGTAHAHRIDLVSGTRPTLGVLLAVAIAGGLLPDPTALAILLAALSSGRVLLGLATVVVFSLGFAATLVVVGVIAAQVGQKILGWLSGLWAVRVQIATTLLILGIGVVLTAKAISQITM